MKKIIKIMFTLAMVMITTFYAENSLTTKQEAVDLNSDSVQVRSITFDQMVNEIALETGDTVEKVTNSFISSKTSEMKLQDSDLQSVTPQSVKESLLSTSYIAVKSGAFPALKGTYQAKGLSFYGEGDGSSYDHARMFKILYIVFDRTDAFDSSVIKQFAGNVYANLEANDKIYYSVDGDFYNNGTTYNTGVSVGVGDSARINYEVRDAANHFSYIVHTGRWFGYW